MSNTDTISLDRMEFTVTNLRPKTNTNDKSEIEAKLFEIFKKYA